jgi:hypothetical protein
MPKLGRQPHFDFPRSYFSWALWLRRLDDQTVRNAAVFHGKVTWQRLRAQVPADVPGPMITRQLVVICQERGLLTQDDANEINQFSPRGPR